ncbi:hypothetical protein BGZ99_009645 [Dissophora globulifera]|uniref:Uncharacterized protein n=1 Tax=Dissophora globulifera TaxID=979702 RepID=A0A9P6R4C7_9FUNG|nr:hypothetical protein BGZ99_009645 [Dissophora globulifera]
MGLYRPIPASKIRVDVGGSLFTTIRYTCSNTHSKTNNAYRRLEHQLIKLSKKDQLVLYVDGHPAAEKAITQRQREQNRHKARDRARKALATLKDHLQNNKRIRKHHITTASKELRSAINWTVDDRLRDILCATETDVKIVVDCKEEDVVVTSDSDLLIYKSVPAVWRPRGGAKSRWYSLYDKAAVLDALDVASTRLVALAILSGNDYTGNIPSLGIETNRKLIKKLGDRDKESIIKNALKVFVSMKQDRVETTTPLEARSDSTLTYDDLRSSMNHFMTQHKQTPTRHELGRAKSKSSNMFATVDKPSSVNVSTYRPRYSVKVR